LAANKLHLAVFFYSAYKTLPCIIFTSVSSAIAAAQLRSQRVTKINVEDFIDKEALMPKDEQEMERFKKLYPLYQQPKCEILFKKHL
jgi:hypothetical protein